MSIIYKKLFSNLKETFQISETSTTIAPIKIINNNNVIRVSIGNNFYVALLSGGGVYAWGSNTNIPYNILNSLTNVLSIACGENHLIILNIDGTVSAYGNNNFRQLNIVQGLSNVIAIVANNNYSLALLNSGQVVGWGENNYGQLNIPYHLINIIKISAGYTHCLALNNGGIVMGWGDNTYGQLNISNNNLNNNYIDIAAGNGFSLLLKSDNTVDLIGDNKNGLLNIPNGLSNIISIAAGLSHILVLNNNNRFITWGDNNKKQLNINKNLYNIKSISAGFNTSIVIETVITTTTTPAPTTTTPAPTTTTPAPTTTTPAPTTTTPAPTPPPILTFANTVYEGIYSNNSNVYFNSISGIYNISPIVNVIKNNIITITFPINTIFTTTSRVYFGNIKTDTYLSRFEFYWDANNNFGVISRALEPNYMILLQQNLTSSTPLVANKRYNVSIQLSNINNITNPVLTSIDTIYNYLYAATNYCNINITLVDASSPSSIYSISNKTTWYNGLTFDKVAFNLGTSNTFPSPSPLSYISVENKTPTQTITSLLNIRYTPMSNVSASDKLLPKINTNLLTSTSSIQLKFTIENITQFQSGIFFGLNTIASNISQNIPPYSFTFMITRSYFAVQNIFSNSSNAIILKQIKQTNQALLPNTKYNVIINFNNFGNTGSNTLTLDSGFINNNNVSKYCLINVSLQQDNNTANTYTINDYMSWYDNMAFDNLVYYISSINSQKTINSSLCYSMLSISNLSLTQTI
jgi:hypothetical protein